MDGGTITLAVAVGFLVGTLFTSLYRGSEPDKPELTCEVVETKIWAFQQCLKFQPSCRMDKGPAAFAEYRDNKSWVAEHCPKNDDGFQS